MRLQTSLLSLAGPLCRTAKSSDIQQVNSPSFSCCSQSSAVPRGCVINSLKRSLLDAGAVWLSMFVLGSGLGVMVASSGLPWWVASLCVNISLSHLILR